jgi:hypothetical protein
MIVLAISVALGCARPAIAHAGQESDGWTILGPATFNGPVIVHGEATIAGPATVYGRVVARSITVLGPPSYDLSQDPIRPDRKEFDKGLTITGPLTIHGPLIVDGELTVIGPLSCAMAKEMAEPLKIFRSAQ